MLQDQSPSGPRTGSSLNSEYWGDVSFLREEGEKVTSIFFCAIAQCLLCDISWYRAMQLVFIIFFLFHKRLNKIGLHGFACLTVRNTVVWCCGGNWEVKLIIQPLQVSSGDCVKPWTCQNRNGSRSWNSSSKMFDMQEMRISLLILIGKTFMILSLRARRWGV